MKLKNLIALLLALAMAFSLAACSGRDKDDEDDDEENEKTPDYTALVEAFEDLLNDINIKNYGKLYGGTLAGNETAAYVKAYYYLCYDEDEDDFKREWEEEIGGKFTVQDAVAEDLDGEAEDLDAEKIQEYVDFYVDYWREQIQTMEGFSDADGKKVARDEDMSADEAKKLGNDIISAMQAVVDKLDGAKIDAVQRVTITVEHEEGWTDEAQAHFILSDGKWFTFELLDQLDPDFLWEMDETN